MRRKFSRSDNHNRQLSQDRAHKRVRIPEFGIMETPRKSPGSRQIVVARRSARGQSNPAARIGQSGVRRPRQAPIFTCRAEARRSRNARRRGRRQGSRPADRQSLPCHAAMHKIHIEAAPTRAISAVSGAYGGPDTKVHFTYARREQITHRVGRTSDGC